MYLINIKIKITRDHYLSLGYFGGSDQKETKNQEHQVQNVFSKNITDFFENVYLQSALPDVHLQGYQ